MQLSSYLKQFKNIAWYPSSFKDSLSMACLSYKSLKEYGISKDDAPDCFIFTDYSTYGGQTNSNRFFLDLEEYEDEAYFNYPSDGFSATAFNIKELDRLDLPFDRHLVAFDHDDYYGRVFIADVLIDHPNIGKTIAKLVYVVIENTTFAFDYLIKKNIKIRYAIHSNSGHGFGGGISNGGFMCNILKDLGVSYFASDIDWTYEHDEADRYLTEVQKNTLPVLKRIDNLSMRYGWRGYNDTILYLVKGYETKENKPIFQRFIND